YWPASTGTPAQRSVRLDIAYSSTAGTGALACATTTVSPTTASCGTGSWSAAGSRKFRPGSPRSTSREATTVPSDMSISANRRALGHSVTRVSAAPPAGFAGRARQSPASTTDHRPRPVSASSSRNVVFTLVPTKLNPGGGGVDSTSTPPATGTAEPRSLA